MTTSEGVTADDIFQMLMESLSWTPSTLQDFQRSQLQQLLRHAREQVPFYKTRLDCVFRSDGTINWDRWTEIPILTRADLRDKGKQLLAKKLPPAHGNVTSFKSSGSTGVPIKVTTTSLANTVNNALWSRFYSLNGGASGGPHVKFWFTKPGNIKFKERWVWPHRQTSNVIYANRNLPVSEQLEILSEIGAETFSEFSTTLVHMAHENLRRKAPIKLRMVIPYGMGLTASDRELLGQSFGAKVLLPYSSKEGGLMAFHVLPDTRYIVNAEFLLVEFLPAPDQADNNLKRMIITPLFNAALPMIRYEQGDLVELAHQTFGDSPLPIINRIVGRSDDYFFLNGKEVPVVGLQDDTMNKLLQAKAYQLAQVGNNAVELRYVRSGLLTPAAKSAVTKHLRIKLQQTFDVIYVKLKTIPANAGGKQQRFKREWMN